MKTNKKTHTKREKRQPCRPVDAHTEKRHAGGEKTERQRALHRVRPSTTVSEKPLYSEYATATLHSVFFPLLSHIKFFVCFRLSSMLLRDFSTNLPSRGDCGENTLTQSKLPFFSTLTQSNVLWNVCTCVSFSHSPFYDGEQG